MSEQYVQRYALPHACESQEIATALAQLSPKQRWVLREYIWQVELGGAAVTEWLHGETCPVSPTSWYLSGDKANYLHNAAFQNALDLYRQAGQRWVITEEARTVEAAQRKLRMGAARAAERMVALVDEASTDMVRLRAAEQVLDRADVATASKAPGQAQVTELSDDELLAIAGRAADAGRGGDGAAAA